MESFGVAAPRHHPSSELVDNYDLALAHNVILVALEQFMRAQGLVDVMHDGDIDCLVERTFGKNPELAQQGLHMFIAGLGEIGRALFFVEFEFTGDEARDHLIDSYIEI